MDLEGAGHGHLEVDKVLNSLQAPHHEEADNLQVGVDTGLMVVVHGIHYVGVVGFGIRCAVAGGHSDLHHGVEQKDSE